MTSMDRILTSVNEKEIDSMVVTLQSIRLRRRQAWLSNEEAESINKAESIMFYLQQIRDETGRAIDRIKVEHSKMLEQREAGHRSCQ